MTSDPASLDNLRDIVVPSSVSWWPPAVGWWFVFALLAAAFVVIGVLAWRTWRANAYRRAALRELQLASGAGEVAGILKRTALCAYPRTEIASLSGMAWCRWLERVGGKAVPEEARDGLTRGVFHRPSAVQFRELMVFAEHWIRNHRLVRAVDGDRPRTGGGCSSVGATPSGRMRTGIRNRGSRGLTRISLRPELLLPFPSAIIREIRGAAIHGLGEAALAGSTMHANPEPQAAREDARPPKRLYARTPAFAPGLRPGNPHSELRTPNRGSGRGQSGRQEATGC